MNRYDLLLNCCCCCYSNTENSCGMRQKSCSPFRWTNFNPRQRSNINIHAIANVHVSMVICCGFYLTYCNRTYTHITSATILLILEFFCVRSVPFPFHCCMYVGQPNQKKNPSLIIIHGFHTAERENCDYLHTNITFRSHTLLSLLSTPNHWNV